VKRTVWRIRDRGNRTRRANLEKDLLREVEEARQVEGGRAPPYLSLAKRKRVRLRDLQNMPFIWFQR